MVPFEKLGGFVISKEEKDQLIKKFRNQARPPIGSLCRIAPWCKNKGRMVFVTEHLSYSPRAVMIQYLDAAGLGEAPSMCRVNNLEVLDAT